MKLEKALLQKAATPLVFCHHMLLMPHSLTTPFYPHLLCLSLYPTDRQTKYGKVYSKRKRQKYELLKSSRLSTLSLSLINASRNIPISHTHFRHLSLPSSLSLSLFLTHKHLLSLTSIFNFPLSNAYSLSHTLSLSVSHFQLANALKGMR